MINLRTNSKNISANIKIGGSKSESNRLLILQALSADNFEIDNLSNSKDTQLMLAALSNEGSTIDIGMAGTAMRFLTSFLAISEGREVTLTGSERMKERPIGELANALNKLGAEIEYLEKESYPPLLIKGKKLKGGKISLNSSISSQFISSLMLVGSQMEDGLEITLEGKVVSKPYIEMTVSLLKGVNIDATFDSNVIKVKKGKIKSESIQIVESDWSSASYHYSIAAIADKTDLTIGTYKKDSYQGDSELANIYSKLGVESTFSNNQISLKKIENFEKPQFVEFNLNQQPDIAQTIAVTCYSMNIDCKLTGLETLRIKETDRLHALKVELEKFGAKVDITNDSLSLKTNSKSELKVVTVDTYDDHRMAMAFAPIALNREINIEDEDVVVKSYPDFWEHLKQLRFECTEK